MEDVKEANSALASNQMILQKSGMTRVFSEKGSHIPVTVLKIIPNTVVQVKSTERDGYKSLKIAFNEKRKKLLSNPKLGELKGLREKDIIPFSMKEIPFVEGAEVGMILSFDSFTKGDLVHVTGVSKGKGFAGVMKKYNFSGGPAAHGSKFHRTTGSIGNRATPGRVWKGKKMPGHMGCQVKTIKNIEIVEVNLDSGYLLIKGSVPGSKNSFLTIQKA